MGPLQRLGLLTFVYAVATLALPPCALAEDTKGKWQFGFGLSYFSTTDYIRSNSDLAITGGVVGDNGLPSVGSVDDRPDINIKNQASIRDDFKLDFSASYGLTRWLALEAAVSYLNAPVGNIEFFTRNFHQGISAPTDTQIFNCGPNPANNMSCWDWTPQSPDETKINTFVPVGTLTEIPIHFSGLVRFRPESPLDPYIGAGVGYIHTDLQTSDEFNRTAARVETITVTSADEGEYNINTRCRREGASGCTNFKPGPLEANLKDTWEWHAVGGVDYYMTDRFSVYVDARYVWTSGSIDIRTDDAHQVRFAVLDEGQILLQSTGKNGQPFNANDPSTWFLWEDGGVVANQHFQDDICPKDPISGLSMCRGSGYLETEDRNVTGALDELCSDPEHPGVGDSNYCEDIGILYRIPPGSRNVDEAFKLPCPNCAGNHILDTEDANGNGFLDRYYLYGIDVCTTSRASTNPRCLPPFPQNDSNVQYLWPAGCSQTPKTLGPFAQATETGCPAFIPPIPAVDSNGNPIIDPSTGLQIMLDRNVKTSAVDDAADTYIIQGGHIRLGGFALGIGFKFTF